MKKLVSLLLVLVTLVSLSLVGCAPAGFDYQNLASNYVTLYDYKGNPLYVTIAELEALVSDDEINEAIDDSLVAAGAYFNKITEGEYYVENGSTISIRYKGVQLSTLKAAGYLKDAAGNVLTDDQIKALTDAELSAMLTGDKTLTKAQVDDLKAFSGGDGSTKDTELTVGSGKFIESLEDGIVGIKVGSIFYPVVTTFPEDYTNSDLAGKRVIFFVTVNHILEKKALPENVDYGDMLAIQYQLKLEGDFAQYTDKYTGLTIETDKDGKYQKNEDGTYKYETDKAILTLANTNKFQVALKLNFNGTSEENPDNASFKDTPIEDRFNVEFTFTYDDKVEVEEDGQKVEKDIKVTAVVTVFGIHSIRYFTHAEAADGTLKLETFFEHMGLEKDKETKEYEYKTYAEYVEKLRENMQDMRDIQIQANRLQGAFDKLVAESRVDLRSEEMQKLQKDYIAEVRGNIDYLYTSAQASGLLGTYDYMASYYGLKDAKEYIMYSAYGYKYDTIDKQIETDAKEYVTERLVFWAFVAKENITLTDAEYDAGLAKYKELYGSDTFMTDNNVSEEALREALLWDKAVGMLADNWTNFQYKPAAGDDDHINHDH